MPKIIGVRFRNAGKVYYFDPDAHEIKTGNHVIVETSRGIECGRVVFPPRELDESRGGQPLKKVIRMATEDDESKIERHAEEAREAFKLCKKKIREHGLDMKLIDAEYTFDHKKLLFYFTADGRIDFRGLIKDLASVFRTRIELRQIGVRDEAKLLGGIGVCGRPLCCSSYLGDFIPVSIKMAKEQNLSLNPTKISGSCGRLMCCLKNEQETYEYLNRRMPGIGDFVNTPGGPGEVHSVNVLKQSVRVFFTNEDESTLEEYPADDIEVLERHKKGKSRKKEREERAERAQALAAEHAERQAEAEREAQYQNELADETPAMRRRREMAERGESPEDAEAPKKRRRRRRRRKPSDKSGEGPKSAS